jgi:[acyl-carrier-protein] S-malonyltransferase
MEGASAQLREKLRDTALSPQRIPVIFNVTGDVAPDGDVARLLCEQVKSPVLFEQTIRRLASFGVDTVVEIGPGSALAGFVRKTAPDIRVTSINNVGDLKKVEELWN